MILTEKHEIYTFRLHTKKIKAVRSCHLPGNSEGFFSHFMYLDILAQTFPGTNKIVTRGPNVSISSPSDSWYPFQKCPFKGSTS